jgi:xanthine dehydrogenase accessory factor
MKKWLETRQVLDRLAEIHGEGRKAALATVVRVRGSAYRHEGAKMLVAEDGTTTGNVSGGCLEADVREVALQVLASGAAARREYCSGTDQVSAWDLGVGCEGVVEVRVANCEVRTRGWEGARGALAAHVPFAICTDLSTGGLLCVTAAGAVGELDSDVAALAREALASGLSGIQSVAGRELFFDVLEPPPQLVIVSGGEDSRHLARFAADVGFRVVVVDHRPALLDPARFPRGTLLVESTPDGLVDAFAFGERAYVVVMTHNYADDREYLRALLGTRVAYIGMLGPRQRTDRIIAELRTAGAVDETRIYGPVGLDIGTDGAEQVALSVIGEILAVRSGRSPASLRERRQPIHAAPVD